MNPKEESQKKKIIKIKKIKSVHSPVVSESKSPATAENGGVKIKNIVKNIEEKKDKLDNYEKEYKNISKKEKEIKSEIYDLMKKIGNENILWNNRSIHSRKCAPKKRTEVSDVLEIIEDLYGLKDVEKVIDELDKLHIKKWEGKFDLRILDNRDSFKRKISKKKTHTPSEKVCSPLVL